jgi:hypothetical protein
MYLDTMRDIYSGSRKIFVDDGVKAASYLPLTELMGAKKMTKPVEKVAVIDDIAAETNKSQKMAEIFESDKESI